MMLSGFVQSASSRSVADRIVWQNAWRTVVLVVLLAGLASTTIASAHDGSATRLLVVGHVYGPGDRLPSSPQDRRLPPAVGALVEVLAHHRLVAHMRVGESGRFAFKLAPGRYEVVASMTPPTEQHVKRCEAQRIDATRQKPVRLTFHCPVLFREESA